ncbi:hypothetical protein AJ80_03828 [Polytolypa hystricis UAMH7299]|uniref:Uncharacterized protein n=1 Tax=Polytolypa hystricis (strain UAMH7299) TaxID=1447883 RepID=A0A2B7YF61_POLH7|nr:hypothetical protein AJ80_03828 [Polytolypa hystricis UAMH7299]
MSLTVPPQNGTHRESASGRPRGPRHKRHYWTKLRETDPELYFASRADDQAVRSIKKQVRRSFEFRSADNATKAGMLADGETRIMHLRFIQKRSAQYLTEVVRKEDASSNTATAQSSADEASVAAPSHAIRGTASNGEAGSLNIRTDEGMSFSSTRSQTHSSAVAQEEQTDWPPPLPPARGAPPSLPDIDTTETDGFFSSTRPKEPARYSNLPIGLEAISGAEPTLPGMHTLEDDGFFSSALLTESVYANLPISREALSRAKPTLPGMDAMKNDGPSASTSSERSGIDPQKQRC